MSGASDNSGISSMCGNHDNIIEEPPRTAMLNSGHTQGIYRDITRSLRFHPSLGVGRTEAEEGRAAATTAILSRGAVMIAAGNEDLMEGSRSHQGISCNSYNNETLREQRFDPHTHHQAIINKDTSNHKPGTPMTKSTINQSAAAGRSVLPSAVPSGYHEINNTTAHKLAAHFADAVLPEDSLSFADHFNGEHHLNLFDSISWRTMMVLLENHYMTHFWLGGPSLAKSRCLRYMETCRGIMICVFIYTLFFSILYPPPTTCSIYQTKVSITLD